MCDKKSLRECKDCLISKYEDPELMCKDGCVKIPPPKTAYELMMAKKKKLDVTMWFAEEKCNHCGHDVYTDGKLFWCSKGCIQNGKRGKDEKDFMGFISDLIK
jgi:hypothetical protein